MNKMLRLELTHFSHKPIKEIISCNQIENAHKPIGLWVSCENSNIGWKSWCEHEEFDGKWEYEYAVIISPSANILLIETAEQIDYFTSEYAIDRNRIDWVKLSQLYDGIIIAPYQRSRLGLCWYYGWDCASGCIWNAGAIERLEIKNKAYSLDK